MSRLVISLFGVACLLPGCGIDERFDRRPETSSFGWLELAERNYVVGNSALEAGPSSIAYGLLPADSADEATPLFVLGPGGPAGSAMFLLAELGPCRANDDGTRCEDNSHALTRLGHVLAIEPRNAGFSYEWLDDPSDPRARSSAFRTDNYNVYADAADTWRVLLDVLGDNPWLDGAPIYFLAESYGALRVSIMLDLLFRTNQYAQSGVFHDDELFERLEAKRLGLTDRIHGQLLLQPLFSGNEQRAMNGALFERASSVLDEIAEETGTPYVRCSEQEDTCDAFENALTFLNEANRSPYDYRAHRDWAANEARRVARLATRRDTLAQLTGAGTDAVDGLFRERREHAYRFSDLNACASLERGDLEDHYGTVEAWDAYFLTLNVEAQESFYAADTVARAADPDRDEFGALLLSNIRRVPTLITRAKFDLLVYSPALVPVLSSFDEVSEALLDTSSGEAVLELQFVDDVRASLPCPEYESSHAVAKDAPAALMAAIQAFVEQYAN